MKTVKRYINSISFIDFFINLLNIQAPLKKKNLRANSSPFMIKTIRNAIMINTVLIKSELTKTGHFTKHKGTFARNRSEILKILFFEGKPKTCIAQ